MLNQAKQRIEGMHSFLLYREFFFIYYLILLNICVVTGHANITYYERSQSVIKLRAAYHRAIIGLIT